MFFPRAELLTPPRFLRSEELQNRLDDLKNHEYELKSFNFQAPLLFVFWLHKLSLKERKGHGRDLTLCHALLLHDNSPMLNAFRRIAIS